MNNGKAKLFFTTEEQRRVRAAGFSGIREERMWSGSFLLVRGVKEAG